jgi:hypothetical protein
MTDRVFEAFLQEQMRQGAALARQSDLLELAVLAPDRYLARYQCKGLVRELSGEIVEATDFAVGIWFPANHLAEVHATQLLTWLHPLNVFHPNIRPPFVCVGHVLPGIELTDLLYQVFEIISFHNWSPEDALNPDAAQWARNNASRFPLDDRPLKRRSIDLEVRELEQPS